MENKYVCSVDIGGTKIATAIMEYPADGGVPHPVFEAEVPTEAQEGGEAVFQRIERLSRQLLRQIPMSRSSELASALPVSSTPRRAPSRMPMRLCPAGPAFSWGRVCARTSAFPLPS